MEVSIALSIADNTAWVIAKITVVAVITAALTAFCGQPRHRTDR